MTTTRKTAFVLPDGADQQKALHILAGVLGKKMPACCTASYVGTTPVPYVPGFQDRDLVVVNQAISSRNLVPVQSQPCCDDPGHGDVPIYGHNLFYVDIDAQFILDNADCPALLQDMADDLAPYLD